MLTKLLSDSDKNDLFTLAELLSLSDKPILWDGKTREEVSSTTDLKNVSIQRGDAESRLLTEWTEHNGRRRSSLFVAAPGPEEVLLGHLKTVPLQKNSEDTEVRWNAVSASLRHFTKASSISDPYAVRVVLYQLMLMALADGSISSIEYLFLDEVKHHFKVDDFYFNEIRERAESMYRETQKTVALILE